MVVDFAALSHIGLKRKENQDSYLVEERNGLYCLAVADGMGGHEEGRRASITAIESLKLGFEDFSSLAEAAKAEIKEGDAARSDQIEAFCSDSAKSAHDAVSKISAGDQIVGTTLTLAILDDDDCYIGHVGDSRIYRFHHGASPSEELFERLTEDQTWEEFSRQMKVENLYGNALRQAIGVGPVVDAEVRHLRLIPGDWLLVCSDGLYKMVSDEDILGLLRRARTGESLCAELVQAALDGGGRDNVAVCVGRIGRPGEQPTVEVEPAPVITPLTWVLIFVLALLIGLFAWKILSQ